MRMYFLIFFCTPAILFNIYYHPYLKKEYCDISPKQNDIFYSLKNKTIIVPEKGEYKTNFIYSGCDTFWYVSGINQLKKENYKVYPKEIIKSIPPTSKKACFSQFNLCAYWLEGEDFENLYLIDFPREDITIFDSPTVLLSPKLMKLIKKGAMQ
jgi:hypothetical protein